VETLLLQERRRRELPSPTPLRPKRQELIDEITFDEPDPAAYDRFCQTTDETAAAAPEAPPNVAPPNSTPAPPSTPSTPTPNDPGDAHEPPT
jgi:hypothetical protein